ncbi:patatin-like phospholipase family protein [Millisia brevis]|uniref:patatin-like phospholipase family protein n=1 Tax=Millisia brevis TaxID=264148 RepID=UPI000833B2B9|nr:patatin-like phospholipase family protein [Millisia brevis]
MGKRVAVALGSGGARGYAHIGVLRELEARGYQVVGVSGSSMGALVGGVYCAGHLDEFTEWAVGLSQRDVLMMLDPSLTAAGGGPIRAEKLLGRVREILGDVSIEDLPIRFTAVATDLVIGRTVWFQHGPIDEAIRSSIAIPGLISPRLRDGRLLADGGILDPLPIMPIAAMNADMVIGVSLGAEDPMSTDLIDAATIRPIGDWLDRVRQNTSQLLDSEMARTVLRRLGAGTARTVTEDGDEDLIADFDTLTETAPQPVDRASTGMTAARLSTFEVLNRSIEVMQASLARHHLASYPPDLVITVPKNACRTLDFHLADEMIGLGRDLAATALSAYEESAGTRVGYRL